MKKYLSNREWLNLFIIGFLAIISILPSVCYFAYGYIPLHWLHEGGLYQTAGAVACFVAGLLSLISFRTLLNQKQHLNSLWMLLFAGGCLFLAGEEISWGQHFFGYDLPDNIAAANFQQEFNLHNSKLIQPYNGMISSILFKILALYLVGLPMFLVAFPTVKNWIRGSIPIPNMVIAIIALFARTTKEVTGQIYSGRNGWLASEIIECIFEICLLILAIECFYAVKKTKQLMS